MLLSHVQDMRKFLALPIDQKTTHNARITAKLRKELSGQLEVDEEEEENEKMKSLKQTKSKTALPKPTPERRELKMAMLKQGKWRDCTVNFKFCRILYQEILKGCCLSSVPRKHYERQQT